VLAAAAGAVAATAAGAIATPLVAQAASSDGATIHVGDQLTDVRATTNLKNVSNAKPVLHLYNGKGGITLHGQAEDGPSVVGTNHSPHRAASEGSNTVGCGVLGFSGPERPTSISYTGTGVYGRSEASGGAGVVGEATDTSTEVYGVEGVVQGPFGRGVFGWSLSEYEGGTGVWGQANSPDGVGVQGYAWNGIRHPNSTRFGTGVMGFSGSKNLPPKGLPNTGVYGIGIKGRGGVFQGDKAQVRLVPSTAASHPSSGAAGDLFVDTSNRLWFCKGGTNWVKLVG
jgi:hypothetical protein